MLNAFDFTKYIQDSVVIPGVFGTGSDITVKLVQEAPIPTPWYETVTAYTAFIGLIGVLLTVGLGWWRMSRELNQAVTLANNARTDVKDASAIDRNLAREQSDKERQHSADEAHLERIATSRRTVYLEAAKQVVEANAFIASLANSDPGDWSTSKGLHKLGVAVAKISILGGMETLLKSREIFSLINQTSLKAMMKCIPLDAEKKNTETLQQKLVELKDQLLTVNRSRDQLEANSQAYSLEHQNAVTMSRNLTAEIFEVHEKIVHSLGETAKLKFGYFEFIYSEMREINIATDEIIIMMRRELGLDSDVSAINNSTNEMREKVLAAMSDLKIEMDSTLS